MSYFHLRYYEKQWYVWDVLDDVEGPLYTRDAIYHHDSIKNVLFTLEALSDNLWFDRGMTINSEFSPRGKFLAVRG